MGAVFIGVYLFALALIFAAIPVLKLIGWWLDGGVEPVLAFVGIFLYLVLVVAVISAPSWAGIIILLVLVTSAALMPVLGRAADSVQNARMQDDRYRSYALALERNPMDAVARIALAEALYKRGDLDQAIEQMEWTAERFPGLAFRLKPELASWHREKARVGQPEPVFCHLCQGENPPGAERCERCGAAFGTKRAVLERIQAEGGARAVVRGWVVIATALIAAGFLLIELPVEYASPLVLAVAIVAAWLFLRWVGGDAGAATDE